MGRMYVHTHRTHTHTPPSTHTHTHTIFLNRHFPTTHQDSGTFMVRTRLRANAGRTRRLTPTSLARIHAMPAALGVLGNGAPLPRHHLPFLLWYGHVCCARFHADFLRQASPFLGQRATPRYALYTHTRVHTLFSSTVVRISRFSGQEGQKRRKRQRI